MANASISYNKNVIQNAMDLNVTSVSNGVDVTYGDYTGTPLEHRSNSSFDIRYNNISQTLNSNNSVTVSFDVVISAVTRAVLPGTWTDTAHVTASIDGYTFWNHTESITQPSTHPGYSRSFSVNVLPLQTSWLASVHFYNDMSQSDDEFYVGMRIYNPNPPDYRPGMHRVGGSWQSHNRGAGKADKRQGGSWGTMRTQDGPGGTGNPPLIRRDGVWRNQSKIGNNAG